MTTQYFECISGYWRECWSGIFSCFMSIRIELNFGILCSISTNLHIIHRTIQKQLEIFFTIDRNLWNWIFKWIMYFKNCLLRLIFPFIKQWNFVRLFWMYWEVYNNLCLKHDFPSGSYKQGVQKLVRINEFSYISFTFNKIFYQWINMNYLIQFLSFF